MASGASSGIGLELASEFARHGFDLLITAEDADIAKAAKRLGELGVQVQTVGTDLAKYDGVETLYGEIKATGRPVDAIPGATGSPEPPVFN